MMHSEITLKEALARYLEHLKTEGKKPKTLYTYGKDCEQILAFFGDDKKVVNMLPAHVAKFMKSPELLKTPASGKDRAPATVNKTKRVLRKFLVWAKSEEFLKTLPKAND